jgi:hypothetical protein
MKQIQYPRPLPAERMAAARIVPNLASTLASIPPGSLAVEVGVRLGDTTDMLLRHAAIAKVLALDHFDLHTRPGESGAMRLGGRPHAEFINTRFSEAVKTKKLETRRGRLDAIKALPASSANAFFVRGTRSFSPLMDELYMCDVKLRARGMIWVADYIMADYTNGEQYDVVRAVNEFVVRKTYDLVFVVLDHTMFCNVVLRRPN